MSSTNNQISEREVIRLLYELLLKWDNVLRYTDQILRSIADRHQSSNHNLRTFQSTPEEIRLSSNQNNRTRIESNHFFEMGSSASYPNQVIESKKESEDKTPLKEKDSTSKSSHEKVIIHKNKSKTPIKKSSPKNSNKSRNTSADELEESLAKLDDIIDYYSQLKIRVYRTLMSRPKSSKAAKDVINEMKDVIKKFDNQIE